MPSTPLITLTTDFGADSPYVAAMKGVVLTIEPSARLVDITHSIAPQDVRQGARVLDQVCGRFPAGAIHVAVVDPGVGTERRLIYVEMGSQRYLAPDNGLLSRIAARCRPNRVIALDNPRYWLPTVSKTFHGRDILAPVAARLARGVAADDLGSPRSDLVMLDWPRPVIESRRITGQVEAIDSFGNVITNVTDDDLTAVASREQVRVQCGDSRIVGISATYGVQPAGACVALVGSSGELEIAMVNGNAARALNLAVGAKVVIDW